VDERPPKTFEVGTGRERTYDDRFGHGGRIVPAEGASTLPTWFALGKPLGRRKVSICLPQLGTLRHRLQEGKKAAGEGGKTGRWARPSDCISQISGLPRRLVVKSRTLESGDHDGA